MRTRPIHLAALPLALAASLSLGACKKSEPATPLPNEGLPESAAQCGKDIDCKGDRICQGGQCLAPMTEQPGMKATEAAGNSSPIPDCKAGDGRTPIPSWTPSLDGNGNLSPAPPQRDGMIVRIELHDDAPGRDTTCNDTELNAFSIPDDPTAPELGGLAVNLKGNASHANGICSFSGFYMNKSVEGMHQGWIETYFGAVDMQKLILSNKYCLAGNTHR